MLVATTLALLASSPASGQELCPQPASATPFDSSRVELLAGDYHLIVVADTDPSPRAVARGHLHLALVTDTLWRYYRPKLIASEWRRWGERPLVGWTDASLAEVGARSSGDPNSRDPDAPGVYYEQAWRSFQVGRVPRMFDGATTKLEVTWMDATGFGGKWRPELSVTVHDSASGRRLKFGGTFCAWRVRAP